jgi:hypothetical protein
MAYLIIAIIAFFLFTLSLCVAAGRADESMERLERELAHERIAWRKHVRKAPTFPGGRTRLNSELATPIENNLN